MPLDVRKETLDDLRDEWADLLSSVEEPLPFLHPAWQRVWLDEFQDGRETDFYAVRDGGRLVGVAPLLRQDGRLEFVGHYKMCDYMDFVAGPGREHDVVGALFGALDDEPWSELDLRGLRGGSPALGALDSAAAAAGLAVERIEEAVAPRVQRRDSWEEYLAGLSKKDRHELRRKLRRAQAAGELQLHVCTAREAIEAHLPVLLRMMVESRSDKARFMSEQMARFFHRMTSVLADEGLLRQYVLELDMKPVASVLAFDYGRRLYMYNSGYDPEYSGLSVGVVSKALVLRDAIESGYECLDFLRGDEAYKYHLGARDRQIYQCIVRRP